MIKEKFKGQHAVPIPDFSPVTKDWSPELFDTKVL